MAHSSRKAILPIDGLRGLAVLLVVISHASNAGIHVLPGWDFGGAGRYGVSLFFILSSFLLTRQFLEASPADRRDPLFWKNYFLRRFLRIYPLYFVCFFIYWLIPDLGLVGARDPRAIIGYFALVQGNGFLWTIPVEIQYYILLPAVALLLIYLRDKDVPVLLVGWLMIALILACKFVFPPRYTILVFPFLTFFLAGSLLAYIQWTLDHRPPPADAQRWLARAYAVAGPASLICALAIIPLVFQFVLKQPLETVKALTGSDLHNRFGLYATLWSLVLLAAINGRGWLGALFSAAPLRFLGKISFSMYLLHMPMIWLTLHFPNLSTPHWVGYLAATIAVATVSFLLIERPFSRITLIKRQAPASGSPPAAAKAQSGEALAAHSIE